MSQYEEVVSAGRLMNISLAVRDSISETKQLPPEVLARFHGVGMVRGEGIVRDDWITMENWHSTCSEFLNHICGLFEGNPVWYRTTDRLTSRVNSLQGCDVNIDERNPSFGLRGIRRSLAYPGAFIREIETIVSLRETHKNLNIFFR